MKDAILSNLTQRESHWKNLVRKFNDFALAMDYDPLQSARERILSLEQELDKTNAKLDQLTVDTKQTQL